MKAKQRFLAAGLILAAVLATGIASGQTWQATAGLTGADVGLDENRLGVALGAGRSFDLPGGVFDFRFAGEYVQKAGSQPRMFTPEEGTPFLGDEEVLLHYLQPVVSLGASLPVQRVVPRAYVGAALALKVSESWTRPVEDGQEQLGYEDTDFTLHAGVSAGVGPVEIDFRYSVGVNASLIVDDTGEAWVIKPGGVPEGHRLCRSQRCYNRRSRKKSSTRKVYYRKHDFSYKQDWPIRYWRSTWRYRTHRPKDNR